MVLIGNVLRAGPSTPQDIALLQFGGSGDLQLKSAGNIAVDRLGRPLPLLGHYTTAPVEIISAASLPDSEPPFLEPVAAELVQDLLVRDAGARPWERDPIDARIVADVIEGRGGIIDSERDVDGYPVVAPTSAPFRAEEWDLATMTRRSGGH
jgi:hypothetical protein